PRSLGIAATHGQKGVFHVAAVTTTCPEVVQPAREHVAHALVLVGRVLVDRHVHAFQSRNLERVGPPAARSRQTSGATLATRRLRLKLLGWRAAISPFDSHPSRSRCQYR